MKAASKKWDTGMRALWYCKGVAVLMEAQEARRVGALRVLGECTEQNRVGFVDRVFGE